MAKHTRHRRLRGDDGDARTKTLASLVGLMIAAAVVALLFVAFDSSSSSASTKPDAGAKPSAHHKTPSATATVAPSSTASSKPSAKAPKRSSASSKPSASASSSPVADSSSHRTSAKRVVYTVKKGDNLTIIAAWFHEHGYGNLYDRNKSVIGNNPNLIHPGQKIMITAGGRMTAKNN